MDFHFRLHTTEQLDNLSLSGDTLSKILSSLKLVNMLFGNHRQLTKSVLDYCLTNSKKGSFHIVDLGCGGGDCIHIVSKKLKQRGIKASFTGIDGNPQSIANANFKYAKDTDIKFSVDDILDTTFSIPDCDLIISSHFVYHFRDEALMHFLKNTQTKRVKHVIFSELYRSKIAYSLFKLSSFILPISKVAKEDGLVAIQRAFTIPELENILNKSGVKNYNIKKKPWFRTLTKIDL